MAKALVATRMTVKVVVYYCTQLGPTLEGKLLLLRMIIFFENK